MSTPQERSPSSDPAGGDVELHQMTNDSDASYSDAMQPTTEADGWVGSIRTRDTIHTVSAIYPSCAEAEGVRLHLIDSGFSPSEVRVVGESSQALTWPGADDAGRDEVLKTVLVDGAVGTAVGTGVGVVGTVALAAASVTLFVASPVVAPLAMLGWFAGLGGLIGAAVGASKKDVSDGREGKFSELVMAAVEAGNAALLVRTHNEAEREQAQKIITDSLQGTDQVPGQS